jgi:hypothetical protein
VIARVLEGQSYLRLSELLLPMDDNPARPNEEVSQMSKPSYSKLLPRTESSRSKLGQSAVRLLGGM